MSHAEKTEAQFDARFETIESPSGETYWTLDQIIDREIPHERVWTVIEAEGNQFILAGNHFVNRVAFAVTDERWGSAFDTYEWARGEAEDDRPDPSAITDITGTITLADGSTSTFTIGTDYATQQYGAGHDRLTKTVLAVEAMTNGLIEAEIEVVDS